VEINRVAVIGLGTMGAGIAQVLLEGGVEVVGRDVEDSFLERARGKIEAGLAKRVEKGRMTAEAAEAARGKLRTTTRVEDCADVDLVVEAIVEELNPKVELLQAIAGAAGGADLATTTSSLSLDEIASGSTHPERTFGLHPFNPVARMDLIELCIPEAASPGIGPRARNWCESIGKTVVEVPNEPGFVVNRLLFPYLFDAVRLMEQTGMKAEDVDRCMTLGANYPMGPLALLDLVGADVAVAIGEALYEDSGEEHHRPPGRLMALVEQGKLGRKSGAGFYEYD
jgi:3-hydroxybutyryl-CoA dehydrogenase